MFAACLIRPMLLAAGVALMAGSGPTLAGPAAPTPALRDTAAVRGAGLVEAVNSKDAALRARVIRAHFDPGTIEGDGEARIVALFDRLHERLGSLAFHHAEAVSGSGDPPRVSLHVYARSARDGGWKDLQFWLDPAPPHRIRTIVFVADVAEPVYLPNGEITTAATLQWLGGYIDKLVAEEDLAGSLLIAQGDRVLFERAFGYADSARRRPVGPATRFNLGSGGKMFTALAIGRLVEAGRLRFGDTLSRIVPAVAGQTFARSVTIGHLLSHTSGVGEFWNDDYERHWHELRSLNDYLPFVLKAGTRFAPGERFEYSNSNYILAGLVIEAVTGKPYDQVLGDQILGPLGMRDTGLFPFDDTDSSQAQRLARADGGGWCPAPHGYRGSSAGGCLSTAADMLRFARALVGGRIVSRDMLAEMASSKTAGLPGDPISYGYGFILEGRRGAGAYGHGGIATGVNFELRYFPDADVTLIAFSNQDNGAYDDLRRNTIKLITGER